MHHTIVQKEDATIKLNNQEAFRVTYGAGISSESATFTLTATVQEKQTDLPTTLAQLGEINKVTYLTMIHHETA